MHHHHLVTRASSRSKAVAPVQTKSAECIKDVLHLSADFAIKISALVVRTRSDHWGVMASST